MNSKIMEIFKNRYAQLLAASLLGVTAGVLLYPTKTVEERVTEELTKKHSEEMSSLQETHSKTVDELQEKVKQEEESKRTMEKEYSSKLESYKEENRRLSESTKKQRFKIIRPDGTIEEKEFEESSREEVTQVITQIREEFNSKIRETEERWKKVYTERLVKVQEEFDAKTEEMQKKHDVEIARKEKEYLEKINEKKLRVEVGMTTDYEYSVHAGYDLWGPFFIGAGTNFKPKEFDDASVGVGVSF